MKTKKQIVEEFLGKMRQRYPRCSTSIFEKDGDGFAHVALTVSFPYTIAMDIEWDDPKWKGYDAIDIRDAGEDEIIWRKVAGHINGILAEAEAEFARLADGGSPKGHRAHSKR